MYNMEQHHAILSFNAIILILILIILWYVYSINKSVNQQKNYAGGYPNTASMNAQSYYN